MDITNKKERITNEYLSQIALDNYIYHKGGSIPDKKLEKAIEKFAQSLNLKRDKDTIIGMYDCSFFKDGSFGYIFTDTKMYFSRFLDKAKKIWYDDISDVQIIYNGKQDCDNKLKIFFYHEEPFILEDKNINKKPLYNFLKEIIKYEKEKFELNFVNINYVSEKKDVAGGLLFGQHGQVNKLFDEEKFNANQGHGFAAERANHLYDKLHGHDAKLLGDNNIKNGADRMVDGVLIQSKYCKTGAKCINECFDKDGNFRYQVNGKPMQIEVPSDKYDEAVRAMEEKIRNGKVPGVSDTQEAKNIVRKGHFTYEQAKNIAKAGTIESLTYDAVNGMIIATSAFGVSTLITIATNLWTGEDFVTSLKLGIYSGLKIGGTTFITTILASQLSKVGLNSALVGSSEAIITFIGPKGAAILVNAFRSGSKIYGAAAMKSAAKLLRGNMITGSITFLVIFSTDLMDISKGEISQEQLFKNAVTTLSNIVGGGGGALGGAALGTMIFPGVGTAIGFLAGSIFVGSLAGWASKIGLDQFIKDDSEKMLEIIQKEFEKLSVDYLLSQKEVEKSVDKLSTELTAKQLKKMYASNDKNLFARDIILRPIIESEVKKRRHINEIRNDIISKTLIDVLDDILLEESKIENILTGAE